ncbi:MAG: lysozyme inhibitor [Bacteroidales bacterium]|nr:lysozyme inhibitor [Bacteroidales bacterium]
MKRKILIFTILATLVLSSCTGTSNKENAENTTIENVTDDIVTTSYVDVDGKALDVLFNNTKGIATVTFEEETFELLQEKAASGIWYKNDTYELRGKANDVDLMKDGELVFSHKDVIVTSSITNKEGQTLDMVFNNTTNTAKIYLDGGEQIELQGQTPGSGIWYKNDQYELRGKGEEVELTKDGKVVFKN